MNHYSNKLIKYLKQNNIIIPTFRELKTPSLIPEKIQEKLKITPINSKNSLDLFRIGWKNDIKSGLFKNVNYLEIPSQFLTTKARIIGLTGYHFPTGSHKVGPAFSCLLPELLSGRFDPENQKCVWPSTGNFCRGGVYIANLFKCKSIAILPEGMSQERFTWLKENNAEIIKTFGSESNVREIFNKCKELKSENPDSIKIFNQFEEFGNGVFHYNITAEAILELFNDIKRNGQYLSLLCCSIGSSGIHAAGEKLKSKLPDCKIAVGEPIQCPTLMLNGYGAHNIEGIGDKHIPWILNTRDTDVIAGIDDFDCMRIFRLFNNKKGLVFLKSMNLPEDFINSLQYLGISSIANLILSIKMANYFELNENDIIFTIFTDSANLYKSRLQLLTKKYGDYNYKKAEIDYLQCIIGQKTDFIHETNYLDKKRIHNLKYFTWVEQQEKNLDKLNEQWFKYRDYWKNKWGKTEEYDSMIVEINNKTNLI